MSSNKKNQSKVVTPVSDEKPAELTPVVETIPVVESPPLPSDTNPIDAKIAGLPQEQQDKIAQFQAFIGMCSEAKVLNDAFKTFTTEIGLYESSTDAAKVTELKGEIAKVKSALSAAGFKEDNPIVVSAVKGLTAELGKAEKDQKDNLGELAGYFKVKLAKASGTGRTYAATGELSTYRPSLSELKSTDYLFSQSDKKAIVVHSNTVASDALDKLGIKADSQTWVAFEYNGLLDFTRNTNGSGKMIAQIKTMPENWVKAHPVVSTSEKLSGLIGTVAATLGLSYNGNGWQSNSELSPKFAGVSRVVKEVQ